MKNKALIQLLLISLSLYLIITKSVIYLIPLLIVTAVTIKERISIILPLVCISIFGVSHNLYKGNDNELYVHESRVIEKTTNGLWVKEKGDNYFLTGDNSLIERNDTITYKCYYNEAEGDFTYYLNSKFSSYSCWAKDINVSKEGNGLNNKVKQSIDDSDTLMADFLDILLFNEGNKDPLVKIGIYHLFVVSGFHISIFISSINSFTKKVTKKNYILMELSAICFTIPLLMIIGPKLPALRALIYEILIFINKWFLDNKFNRKHIISYLGIGFITFNPYFLFNQSFLLSFLIVIFINMVSNNKKTLKIAFVAFAVSAPLISSFSASINLLTPLMTLILTPLIVPGLLISCFLIYIPSIWFIFDFYFYLLNIVMNIFSHIYIPVSFSFIPPWLTILLFTLFLI